MKLTDYCNHCQSTFYISWSGAISYDNALQTAMITNLSKTWRVRCSIFCQSGSIVTFLMFADVRNHILKIKVYRIQGCKFQRLEFDFFSSCLCRWCQAFAKNSAGWNQQEQTKKFICIYQTSIKKFKDFRRSGQCLSGKNKIYKWAKQQFLLGQEIIHPRLTQFHRIITYPTTQKSSRTRSG